MPIRCLRWVFPDYRSPIPFQPGRILIGRDEKCGAARVCGSEVSRHHAEVRCAGAFATLHDLGAKNGTFVNGARVARVELNSGDVIRCGEHIGVVGTVEAERGRVSWFGELAPGVFGGPELDEALGPARQSARTDLPIIIEGETGTGKEMAARAIHAWSGRAGPFHALDCASIAPSLVEAELFGYAAGAFTGATREHPGRLRSADRGTLFLDETTELPLALQPKLLRALQEREVVPLGSSRASAFDARILCGSQTRLDEAVARGELRGDVYARLNGLTVRLPPLCRRIADVPGLFLHFVRRYGGGRTPAIDARLVESLCLHHWPYNVRGVEMLAQRLMAVHGHEPLLRQSHLPDPIRRPVTSSVDGRSVSSKPSGREDHAERRKRELAMLVPALEASAGNLAGACRAVGLDRSRGHRLLQGKPGLLEEIRGRAQTSQAASSQSGKGRSS